MSDKLVENELLAFLQQKLDVIGEVSALQICVSNFSEEEIAAAKLLIFRSLNKEDRMVSRRRDGPKKSMQDIITLLKTTDPEDVPVFVARDLKKLPLVTLEHVDVTSLLKDITYLKTSLADVKKKLETSERNVTELRTELDELRNSVKVSGSPISARVNTRHGASSATSYASAVLLSSPSTADNAECDARSYARPAPVSQPIHCKTPRAPLNNEPRATAGKKLLQDSSKKRSNDDDGFVTVQNKKHRQQSKKNCCGTAPSEPNINVRAAKPNTPVYISRLHYTTKAEDIVEYVRHRLKYTARVQLLESRRNVNFKAFVVRVPTCYLHLVMEETFWPQGVVFRRFRGQVPPDRTVP